MVWHNFHPHSQRWTFADDTIDVRSISPAESFVVETTAPPVLLLPASIAKSQASEHRHKHAKKYHLRGDFLVHCHIEPHMMLGLACVVRSHQTVWLTPAEADSLAKTTGLPIDPGNNDCTPVKLDRCATAANGQWELVTGDPAVIMMHSTLLAGSNKVLFWGYFDKPPGAVPNNQSRLWDPASGYTIPSNQPGSVSVPPGNASFSNLHSAGHTYLGDGEGTLLAHGGETAAAPPSNANNQQAFLFHPSMTLWERVGTTQGNRFYATTLTLADGRLLTMYGQAPSIEVFDPASKTWSNGIGGPVGSQLPLPMATISYDYYPWAYLLPNGDIFIAGHQGLSTRFSWTPAVVVHGQWPTVGSLDRSLGGGQLGTSVLLPLRPPGYAVRVLNAAGTTASSTEKTSEMIDLSQPTPAWTALPPLKFARAQECTATLLPDGRVFLSGGTASAGPGEIFDPEHSAAGWTATPPATYQRG